MREPSQAVIEGFLARQRAAPFSYREVGGTRDRSPAGYDHDHARVELGTGAAIFDAARAALAGWRMFPPGWARVVPGDADIVEGTTVAVLFRVLGAWWLNACRIVYTLDEAAPSRRFGFAYGTLAHVECGEERFEVVQHEDGSVWYDVRAFSRPRHWATRLAYPLSRRFQRRFVAESQATMRRAVGR